MKAQASERKLKWHEKVIVAALFVLAAAIVVTSIMAGNAAAATFAPQAKAEAPIPNPPLAVWMTVNAKNHKGGVYGVTLYAQSATDMPVPYVTVYVTTCENGQSNGFRMANKPRRLARGQESLTATFGGKVIAWTMFSAPANTARPTSLTLNFTASNRWSGGPVFCVKSYGYTREGTRYTTPTEIAWDLGPTP